MVDKEGQRKMFLGALMETGARIETVMQSVAMLGMVAMLQQETKEDQELVAGILNTLHELRDSIVARIGPPEVMERLYNECKAIVKEEGIEQTVEGKVDVPGMSAGYL